MVALGGFELITLVSLQDAVHAWLIWRRHSVEVYYQHSVKSVFLGSPASHGTGERPRHQRPLNAAKRWSWRILYRVKVPAAHEVSTSEHGSDSLLLAPPPPSSAAWRNTRSPNYSRTMPTVVASSKYNGLKDGKA
eukprot:4825504-Pleurochrysis_carterae.AAC.3